MPRPTAPHPAQQTWAGEGTLYRPTCLSAQYVRVPVEWTETVDYVSYLGSDKTGGVFVKQSFLSPDELWLYQNDQTFWQNTAVPILQAWGHGTTPDASQLLPAPWTHLSGEFVEARHYNQRETDGRPRETIKYLLWETSGAPQEWLSDPPTTYSVNGPGILAVNNNEAIAATYLNDSYMTPGELWVWQQINPQSTEPPGEDLGSVAGIPIADVLTFAGLDDDPAVVALVETHLGTVVEQVRAYTRGVGFDPETGNPNQPLAAVIVSATARSAANPTGATRLSFGELRTEPGIYQGWTLAEQAILHNYRKRWT